MQSKTFTHYLTAILKSLLEFIPIFLFIITFEGVRHNFFIATFVMIIATILFTFYSFHKEKRLPYIALFISLETTLFGGLTLFFKNPAFVQMRDTFYDLILGSVIIVTALFNSPIIKRFFGHIFELKHAIWVKLSYMWGPLLILFAIFNEYVRRSFPPFMWVKYKILVLVITCLFGVYCLIKYRKDIQNFDEL
ncbi:MAG: intracellular septation protein [Patescibacteria group bacterium]|nr:intracellular septation protein [Patescibacteria group bacterium]